MLTPTKTPMRRNLEDAGVVSADWSPRVGPYVTQLVAECDRWLLRPESNNDDTSGDGTKVYHDESDEMPSEKREGT